MAAQKGLDLILKVGDGGSPESFTQAGGLRSNNLTINNETVDVTNKSSSGVRVLLEGAGVNSIDLTASGVFEDDAHVDTLRDAAENNTFVNCQLVVPGDTYGRTYEGAFQIASFAHAGEYNGEMTYEVTLNSSGTITKS